VSGRGAKRTTHQNTRLWMSGVVTPRPLVYLAWCLIKHMVNSCISIRWTAEIIKLVIHKYSPTLYYVMS
jgi:hypothetical protein